MTKDLKIKIFQDLNNPRSIGYLLNQLIDKDEKTLISILTTIRHISEQGGFPIPPHAKPLKEVNNEICEMRIKYDLNNLLRIYYFVNKEEKVMLLLNFIIKPDGRKFPADYEGKKGKKLLKEIGASVEYALELKSNKELLYTDLEI
ncbi:hypothetical protein COB57_02745 [Candidatus Peregrinibacteria bacterium]|nr:MAG: hypothetical protein COB57_02745 [Candidatus Peregrinibacteria bacterium]